MSKGFVKFNDGHEERIFDIRSTAEAIFFKCQSGQFKFVHDDTLDPFYRFITDIIDGGIWLRTLEIDSIMIKEEFL